MHCSWVDKSTHPVWALHRREGASSARFVRRLGQCWVSLQDRVETSVHLAIPRAIKAEVTQMGMNS